MWSRLAFARRHARSVAIVSKTRCATRSSFHLDARAADLARRRHVARRGRCGRRAWNSAPSMRSRTIAASRAACAGSTKPARTSVMRVRLMAQVAGVHRRGGAVAGARHRRQHGDLQLVDAVMLRTLPVSNPQDLFFLGARQGRASGHELELSAVRSLPRARPASSTASPPTARRRSRSRSPDGLENVTRLWVSGNFHAVLGVPMALGRGFAAESRSRTGDSLIA